LKTNNLQQNSSFSILNNILQLIVSFGSGMIIARVLGPEGKGSFYLASQIVSIGAVFFSIGIGPSLLFFLKKKILTKNEAVTISIIYSSLIILILTLLYVFFKNHFVVLLNNTITEQMLLIVVILMGLNLLINFWSYIVMNNDRGVKTWSIISSVGNIIYLFFLFFLVYKFYEGVMGALYALMISILIKAVVLMRYIFVERVSFKISPIKKVRKIITYALGIFIGNLFLTGVYRIDIFFVNNILSVKELGLYSASVNISELLLLIPSAVGVALFPHLSGLEKKEQTLTMAKIGRLSTVLGIVGSLSLLVIAYPFIIIVFGDKFIDSFVPTLFLLPGLVAMTLNYAYSNYLNSIGKPYIAAKIFTVGIIVNIILNSLFLKAYGIKGAAIFSSITYCIITTGFIFSILKENKELKLKDIIIPNQEDYKYILIKIKNSLNVWNNRNL
jgi:O-antigen/teichoic acid export membrane protein